VQVQKYAALVARYSFHRGLVTNEVDHPPALAAAAKSPGSRDGLAVKSRRSRDGLNEANRD
jgi:hypothetical protein